MTAAITIAALMLATWVVSVAVRNASIVDIVWGLGFVAVAWTVLLTTTDQGLDSRRSLLVALTTVWGLRLGGYLFRRNHGNGEDYRYRAMRKRWGSRFTVVSLGTVFALQGTLMWIVSLPVQRGLIDATPSLGVVAWVGVALWIVGFGFEVFGDAQLARFKANPVNAGQVMDRGVWRYTRHPNYFGDACLWWGLGLIGAETGQWWVLVGPAVMTVLLVRVSGVALLEKSLSKRKPGYAEYVTRTSAFIPMPPRRTR
jgi:steroid 5-alpha reductase family enzyme